MRKLTFLFQLYSPRPILAPTQLNPIHRGSRQRQRPSSALARSTGCRNAIYSHYHTHTHGSGFPSGLSSFLPTDSSLCLRLPDPCTKQGGMEQRKEEDCRREGTRYLAPRTTLPIAGRVNHGLVCPFGYPSQALLVGILTWTTKRIADLSWSMTGL